MGDGRTERWAAHRVAMRAKLVDAAIEAIEADGPQATVRAITARAGVPTPTLYRFFTDKSDLATAIADRARRDIVDGLTVVRDRPDPTPGALIHAALAGYAQLIVEHPNVARFLFRGEEANAVRSIESWYAIRTAVTALIGLLIESPGTDGRFDASLYSAMITGAVENAAERWSTAEEPMGTADDFVALVEPVVRAMITAAATAAGTVVDFDAPLAAPTA
ncbi:MULTISPECIES: TetR/AcrR family transcriptional regulator [unclassified Nocardia]|uniref:TetR/AcrR family transcriptional regulator n=1 Tax=unclassified Nocardia TaxID=2637762 RepID=UPI0033A265BF